MTKIWINGWPNGTKLNERVRQRDGRVQNGTVSLGDTGYEECFWTTLHRCPCRVHIYICIYIHRGKTILIENNNKFKKFKIWAASRRTNG